MCLYNFLRQEPTPETIKIIVKYLNCKEEKIILKVMNVNKQPNANDCGLYAIAYATALSFDDPTELKYDEKLTVAFRKM